MRLSKKAQPDKALRDGDLSRLVQTLQERESRLSSIFDQAVAGLVQVSIDGRFLLVNDRYCQIVGRSREDLLNMRYQEITHAEDVSGNLILFANMLETGKPYVIEKRYVKPDGSIVWVQNSVSSLKNGFGEISGVIAVIVDITDRMKAQEKLEAHAEELARSNDELERFAHIASHDLKEPLRAVRSYIQLLERRYKDRLDSEAQKYITFAVEGACRMQTLIDDLLAYSSISRKSPAPQLVNFNEIMHDVRGNLGQAICESGARVEVGPLPTVFGDRTQLVQLMQNLISNALKFRKDRPIVKVSARETDDGFEFQVQDNGIGIKKEYFDRIFLLFQRLHENHRYPGTGLGLALCKKIVDRHGGRIWPVSEPEQGTTIFFTLPTHNHVG